MDIQGVVHLSPALSIKQDAICSPGFPPHAIAHVSFLAGDGDNDSEHVIVRDGHVLRVFAPKRHIVGQHKSEHELEVHHFVGLIETLISTIDFEQSSTVFLVLRRNGHCLVPTLLRPTTFTVTHLTWERLIDEREIEINEWTYDMNRRGRWNNTDVEIWYGHEDHYLRFMQKTMVSLDALRQRNLDLHFKVLGHMVHDDEVVGIVMEPKGGRYVEFRDRVLAYNAFQELQKDNLLIGFPQFSFSNMKISDGKEHFETRTLQLLRDLSYERDPERSAHTRKNHWDSLDSMMDILESLMRVCNQNP
ncbi:uncharacterized protein EV420DRAFT_1717448 [Desarmillaria tabescens]|uniref:Uncharacterized protein n=1 Tax=Armillaria tabescens TaxID=1929756 RepID=A0AA39JMV2_ARMTA|nr:uncharacterized protein EV420DRAFT_1717448 [Desarmillaria tabescens]KAK0445686.1 hypothetical protein EV420DRAFT_1717448 [Desarmillaria tabescens]